MDFLKWDGSDITKYLNSPGIKLELGDLNSHKYLRISYMNGGETKSTQQCLIRSCSSTLPCIIDELKPVFELTKMGTHQVKVNTLKFHQGNLRSKLYILIKVPVTPEGEIILEPTLKEVGVPDNFLFVRQVQSIFTFRELLGITKSYETSIRVRSGTHFNYPYSAYEANMRPAKDQHVVPNTVLEKWFVGITIEESTKQMLKVNLMEEITERTSYLKSKIDRVIERVDRQAVTYSNYIIERILYKLLSCF